MNEKVDGNDQRTGDFDAGGERINGEEPGEEWEYPASYPYSDSPEIEGNALIGPEKWGSRYISESPVKELTLFKSTEEAPPKISALSTEYPRTASEERRKKLTKQSAQRLAETLTKERDTRSSSKAPKEREEQKPPVREFELTIAKSIFNHEAYIERQAYYAGFNPDMRTIMSEDLRGRAPLEGHLDCSLKKPDVPLRIRLRRQETARPQVSLMELWERGKRERGEI